MEYILYVMKKHLRNKSCLSGRTDRKEFWVAISLSILIYLFMWIFYVAYVLLLAWFEVNPEYLKPFLAIVAIPFSVLAIDFLWAFCAAVFRRLHDVGMSSGYAVLGLFFPIGTIILLFLLCRDSDGDNPYGNVN